MRLGKRMKQIVNLLSESEEPLTLTEIIVNIIGKPYNGVCFQVASALIDSPISFSDSSFTRIKGKKRSYHPIDYGRILYANYSRALRTLVNHGIVRPLNYFEYPNSKRYHGRYILNVNKKIVNVKEVS